MSEKGAFQWNAGGWFGAQLGGTVWMLILAAVMIPLSLTVAAVIYVGFAAVGGSATWILYETAGVAVFSAMARLGMRRSPIWLAAGWALHPIWDAALHLQGSGATLAPEWYVVACISFDLLVAAFIHWNRSDL